MLSNVRFQKNYTIFTWLLSAFFSYWVILCILWIHNQPNLSYHFGLLPAFVAITCITRQFWNKKNKRMTFFSWQFSFFFLFSCFLGLKLTHANTFGGWYGFLIVISGALCASPCLSVCTYKLYQLFEKKANASDIIGSEIPKNIKKTSEAVVFWRYFTVIFALWLPVFLAYYPGIFAYDVYTQIPQVIQGSYDSFHPLLHTLFMGFFYILGGTMGSHSIGIALYTIFQMLILALILSYALLYLYRIHCSKRIRIIILLFFSIFPVFPMMAISATKDTFFSAFLLLAALFFHQWFQNPSLFKNVFFMLLLCFSLALICLFRNNGIIALGIALILGFFILKDKKLRYRFITLMLSGLLLFGIFSFSIQKITNATPGQIKESLSVPLQQISRVYVIHKDDLDVTDKIEEFIPGAYAYMPALADAVKAFANVGVGNIKNFLLLWKDLLLQYPTTYIDAFLFNTLGYWYINDLSHAEIYGSGLSTRLGYLLTDTKEGFDVYHTSLFPALEHLYENLFSDNQYQLIPVFSIIFSPAFFLWFFLFLVNYAMYSKNYSSLLLACLFIGNFITLLLGPCAIIRYAFPFLLICPVLFGISFQNKHFFISKPIS